MGHRTGERGLTLIENMTAMAVLLIGAAGMISLHTMGLRMNGDARRMTRATAVAQDLVNNMELWAYDESTASPLFNATAANDADVADTAGMFESEPDPVGSGLADHGEETLTALGAAWMGIPVGDLGGEYERYWNVAYVDTNGDGVNDAVDIAVIVRWRQGTGFRRIVLHALKLNPAAR